ncbi:MAG: acyltransferase [Acidobacteriaceae bacterium]|nr:acyltransferase [Acidobacteriaceae bacterium]
MKEPTAMRRKYLGLQILRFVAAFMVLVTHSGYYASERLAGGFGYWKNGAAGVDIFFVLSGFVMIYSSTKLFGDPKGWKIFAERRIVRIVPLYWLATTAKVILLLVASGVVLHAKLGMFEVIASYLFLPSRNSTGEIGPLLGVGWTLNFEMFFYFLFTLALWLRLNVYRFVGSVLILLSCGAFIRHSEWPAISFYLKVSVLEFLYGMLIARACMKGRHLPVNAAVAVLLLAFWALVTPWQPMLRAHAISHGLAAALIIYSMASLEDRLTRIPNFVLYLADASYAIYLFHSLIAPGVPAVFAKLHLTKPWLSIICSVLVSLGVGSLIHSCVEEPITRFFRDRIKIAGKKVIHLPNTT